MYFESFYRYKKNVRQFIVIHFTLHNKSYMKKNIKNMAHHLIKFTHIFILNLIFLILKIFFLIFESQYTNKLNLFK